MITPLMHTMILPMMTMTMMIPTYASSSSEEDYYNHTNVIIDMYGNIFTIDGNDTIIPYNNEDNNNKPITIQAAP